MSNYEERNIDPLTERDFFPDEGGVEGVHLSALSTFNHPGVSNSTSVGDLIDKLNAPMSSDTELLNALLQYMIDGDDAFCSDMEAFNPDPKTVTEAKQAIAHAIDCKQARLIAKL